MVPVTAEPPGTPLTCQVTAVLVPPLTVAINCAVPPMRIWEAPAIVTVLVGGGWIVPLSIPEQPPRITRRLVRKAPVSARCERRKCGLLCACEDIAGMVP